MDTTSPTLLVRLRHKDDQQAWGRFWSIYSPLLSRWAEGLARKWDLPGLDVEELLSDVWAHLARELPRFPHDPQKKFRGWLRKVLESRGKDLLRRRNRLPATGQDLSFEESSGPDAAQLFEKADYNRYLVERAGEIMKADFSEPTWQAVWENVVEEAPAAAVAEKFNLSVEAVYAARYRVLRRLREKLSGLLDE